MTTTKLILKGVEELRDTLRRMPDAMVGEATAVINDAARGAHREVEAVYRAHEVTGNLADRLELMEFASGRGGVILRVRSRAKHAWLFEHGTKGKRAWHRHNKNVGKMPGYNAFIPPMIRHRTQMWDRLRALGERYGLTVTGRV